jgi:RNA polymerase sigma-70 factor (ECF subfamily)
MGRELPWRHHAMNPRTDSASVSHRVDHLFRREAGNLVAALTRAFGLRNLELAEDVVQETLCAALEKWTYGGIPDNPPGWLYAVARNKALDALRRKTRFQELSPEVAHWMEADARGEEVRVFLDHEIPDGVLRMMFVCCHPELSPASQVALILKTLSGFSAGEIAKSLLTSEANVNKRIFRAKTALQAAGASLDLPPGPELADRVESVRVALYLLFNQGYHSAHPELAVRKELCFEAMRLALALQGHPTGDGPATSALLALMCFHAARLDSRLDDDGSLVLLKEQDRDRWDRNLIGEGLRRLETSGAGSSMTRYHLEAALAAHHCTAPDFASTDWAAILDLYDRLLAAHPGPVVELNRALALGQLQGPEKALHAIEAIAEAGALSDYHFYHAALGEIRLELGQFDRARGHFSAALALATNRLEKELLQKRLDRCAPQKTE